MNWINHLNTVATVIVSAEVASFCMSAVFFSDRLRRWKYRKRWGGGAERGCSLRCGSDGGRRRCVGHSDPAALNDPAQALRSESARSAGGRDRRRYV